MGVLSLKVLVLFFAVTLGCCGWWQVSFANMWYRLSTSVLAMKALYTLPDATVKAYLDSYELFGLEGVTADNKEEGGRMTVNYYQVVNHLCSVGEVEKMYIPPIMDSNAGVFGNQMLWEEKGMADKLDIKANQTVFDMGCGRGRVAHHVATYTGAKVIGLNIDPGQVATAKEYAETTGLLGKQLDFVQGNYNDKLPFADGTFDALYQVQVLTYCIDPVKLFKEWYRVLKPGAKASILDYVLLDNYDAKDPHHKELLIAAKQVLGTVWSPYPKDFTDALEKAGFKIVSSEQASLGGYQAQLFEWADQFYVTLTKMIHFLVKIHVLPEHLQLLFDRLVKNAKEYIEGDRLGLFTTSWQIIAQKPL